MALEPTPKARRSPLPSAAWSRRCAGRSRFQADERPSDIQRDAPADQRRHAQEKGGALDALVRDRGHGGQHETGRAEERQSQHEAGPSDPGDPAVPPAETERYLRLEPELDETRKERLESECVGPDPKVIGPEHADDKRLISQLLRGLVSNPAITPG